MNYRSIINPVIYYTLTAVWLSIPENKTLKSVKDIVTLKAYNIPGNEVTTLINEKLQPGEYEYKFGARLHGQGTNLPPGVYYYRPEVGNYSEAKKMLLIK